MNKTFGLTISVLLIEIIFLSQERLQRPDSREREVRSGHSDPGQFVHDFRRPTLRRSATHRRRHGLRDATKQLHDDERL